MSGPALKPEDHWFLEVDEGFTPDDPPPGGLDDDDDYREPVMNEQTGWLE